MASFYQCTAIIIQILTTLLQLKYQGTTDQTTTPFAAHPTTMLVLVSSSTINYLACIALLRYRLRRFGRVAANLCLVCSGYASVASLAALLLPDSVRFYVYCILIVLISVAEVLCCCKLVMEEEEDEDVGFQARRRRTNRFLNNFCRVATNPNGRRSHLLPV